MYAVLQETSGAECESWLTFIKYEGNEAALTKLSDQLNEVEWGLLDNLSYFDLDLTHLVSEQTAREMCQLDLNKTLRHRKFDGHLLPIDFKFKPRQRNEKKICKVFDILSYGQIENFIDSEDKVVRSASNSPRNAPVRDTPTDLS